MKLDKIKVTWCRKSNIGEEYPFGVKFDDKGNINTFKNVPVVKVSRKMYDKIGKTLDDMPPRILKQIKQINCTDNGKSAMWGFVITDGEKWLAIDTQGFNYPQYKSPIRVNGKVLPFMDLVDAL